MHGTKVSLSRKALRIASILVLCAVPSTHWAPRPDTGSIRVDAPFTSDIARWPFGAREQIYVSGKRSDAGPAFLKRTIDGGFPVPAEWRTSIRSVRDASLLDRLTMVNGLINSVPYVRDKHDEWKHPIVFLRNGGDCDCAAVAKYVLLRELGVAASDIRIVGVADRGKPLLHAVAVVRSGPGRLQLYVLDNRSNDVRSAFYASEYTPLVSMNENGVWLHDERGVTVAPAFADPVVIEP